MKQRIELLPSLSAREVAARLRRASQDEGWSRRVLAFYLHEMHERRLFLATGHANTAHFAEAQLEMSARCCREHIQVGRELRNLELLDDAFREDAITWSKVVLLLRVIQRETQQAWVDLARRWPYAKLRDEVMGCRPGDLPGEGDNYGLHYQKQQFDAEVPDELMMMIEATRVRLSESGGELLSNTELLQKVFQHMQHCGGHPPTPEPTAQSHHHEHTEASNEDPIPEATRDHVLRRDGHRCCNCNTHFDVEIHHIELRSRGGTNAPSNLVTLCKTCHASMHRDLLQIHGNPEQAPPVFHSADGNPIQRGGLPPPLPIPTNQH